MTRIGFPHSEIAGSMAICTSPTLIAAYHVLHRLPVPRHPPGALSSLTENNRSTKGRWSKWLLHFATFRRSCLFQLSKSRYKKGQMQNLTYSLTLRICTGRVLPTQENSKAATNLFIKTLRGSPKIACGAYRVRTGDLVVANHALSQLS
jgi:hypothetical protein